MINTAQTADDLANALTNVSFLDFFAMDDSSDDEDVAISVMEG